MKPNLILHVCVFCVVTALSTLPAAGLEAGGVGLTAERYGTNLTLRWTGREGVCLQKSTCLCTWEYVPTADSNCTFVIAMNEPAAFFRLVDVYADTDGDLLTRDEEETGWTIFVDTSGFGQLRLLQLLVTSNPDVEDTDGDGLTDWEEWLFGTDPRATDTDHDGLSDYEEVIRWHTSPASVDTDGDARGPEHTLPPKAQLFDGNELRVLHSSPNLEDTDGDGRTDYEEYDQLGRSPLVAQLPNLSVRLVDAVDIRLDVEYAEETGKTFQYGTELSEATTVTHADYVEDSVQASLTLAAQYQFGLGGGWTVGASVSFGYGHMWSTTDETAKKTENSYSQYNTDSRTRTETAASGSMSGGIRLVNTGPVTYNLTDFGLTVRYWMSGDTNGTNGEFRTLATLVPALGEDGVTLAPGDSTPVLQVQAKGLNASRVKEFMARPNSLYLEPAFYELENAEGLNFDFLEEETRWRTARVQIDAGDGQNEEYRIATNVERNQDGSYAGVTMGNVMSNILSIPFQTVPRRTLQTNSPTNERVLYSVRDLAMASVTNGFWVVGLLGGATTQGNPDFENIVLHAGDDILLTFIRDDDGDGLFAPEEQHFGTTEIITPEAPPPSDTDGDGLTDVFEARFGWDVVVLNRTNHVYSDPRQVDQDNDSLSDWDEFQRRTDPTKPDTDNDGLADNVDQHPLVPAKVIRVKWDAMPGGTNGATWATAFTNLQDALSLARAGAVTGSADDDVAEIWVAAGIYKPTTTNDRSAAFQLVNNTAIYGGFRGVETKLSQRESNPLLNDTILSGDLLGNDASTPWDDPATYNDNSSTVCRGDTDISAGSALDGFTITGGNATNQSYGGGLFSYGRPRLKNLFFRANYGVNGAGLWVWIPTATAEPYTVSDCLFLQNGAGAGGAGGMLVQGQLDAWQPFVITNCHFYENAGTGDGGGLVVGQGVFDVENCTFAWNTARRGGGMEVLRPAVTRISRCKFVGNTATNGGAGLFMTDFLSQSGDLKVEVLQSVFWDNSTPAGYGGAIHAQGGLATKRLYVLNSTMVSNVAVGASGTIDMTNCTAWIENSILWGRTNGITGASLKTTARTTCLPNASIYPGAGNINADPKFVNSFGGDLRLQADSPCIDRGNNYIDYHPTVPGFQLIPETDINGFPFWRVLDGDLDGILTVDMGAHEYRGL